MNQWCLETFLIFPHYAAYLNINDNYIIVMNKVDNKSFDSKINLRQGIEIKYWCKNLNCLSTELIQAVCTVGPIINDVKEYFQVKRKYLNNIKPT